MSNLIEEYMRDFGQKINTKPELEPIDDSEIKEELSKLTVVLLAGGKGERIRSVTHNEDINKVMIRPLEQESLIEMTIKMYANAGVQNFVVLTGFLGNKVMEHLGDGSKYGVTINYSPDPDRLVGSGGAILNALTNGTLHEDNMIIIHNPDDIIILGDGKSFPVELVRHHIHGRNNGTLSTIVAVPYTSYAYSGMIIDKGFVRAIQKYPKIYVPAHTGVTAFEPEALQLFKKYIDINKKTSFENVILPILSNENKLFAYVIPTSAWIPVNDLKGLNAARSRLRSIGLPK